MKKETTVIAQIELTKIHKGDEPIPTARELKSAYSQLLSAHTYDAAHINVKIFETEKEESISTEDLIAVAKHCFNGGKCIDCPMKGSCTGVGRTKRIILDRLEELHNQQTATPKVKSDIERYCTDCKHISTSLLEEPCCYCKTEWERA